MATKSFNDVVKEIKDEIKLTSKGEPKKSFSRGSFDKMATAMLNDTSYGYETVSLKGGEKVKTTIEPSKEVRGYIKKVLIERGVDKQEAEIVMSPEYQLPKAEFVYPLTAAMVYEYTNTGKKFDFPTKEDFKASITLDNIAKGKKEHKDIRDKEKTFVVETAAHKKMKTSSTAPKWLKKRK